MKASPRAPGLFGLLSISGRAAPVKPWSTESPSRIFQKDADQWSPLPFQGQVREANRPRTLINRGSQKEPADRDRKPLPHLQAGLWLCPHPHHQGQGQVRPRHR